MAKRDRNGPTIVIVRREEGDGEGGHHGGAWKIAYADFVTAMMAFFLLMWLINATTEAQRVGLADYFAPTNVLSRGPSGAGEPFGGRTINSANVLAGETPPSLGTRPVASLPGAQDEPEEEEEQPRPPRRFASRGEALPAAAQEAAPPRGPAQEEAGASAGREDAAAQAARAALAAAAEEIRQAVQSDPALAELARQLIIEQVREGLRIQLVDAEGQPVFATGQAAPNQRGRALLLRVAAVLAKLPNGLDLAGHTDAAPFRGGGDRSNWELSSERASAARRVLLEAGIAEDRLRAVAGRADRELLTPERPLDAANRRVSILVLIPGGAAGSATP